MLNSVENPKFRLNKIAVKDFKSFDSLEVVFPKPIMDYNPDVFIMGSLNGLGKTSILEACSLLFISLYIGKDIEYLFEYGEDLSSVNLYDFFIKAGTKESSINAEFEYIGQNDKQNFNCSLTINRNKKITINIPNAISKLIKKRNELEFEKIRMREIEDNLILQLLSIDNESLILPFLMYFNSNRKIQSGTQEFDDMLFDGRSKFRKMRPFRRKENQLDRFKTEIIKIMISKADLFGNIKEEETEKSVDFLNKLFEKYAKGKIDKLESLPGNKIGLRIKPLSGEESFPFDGLSSGQKEIISTFFLIWKNTKNYNGIVLIDEPELHLNIEWQHSFIDSLNNLIPNNQYILATHSKEIFASVESDYRGMLTPNNVKGESL